MPRQAGSCRLSQTLGISKVARVANIACVRPRYLLSPSRMFVPALPLLKAWLRGGLRCLRSALVGLARKLAFVGRSLPRRVLGQQPLLAKFLVATVCPCKRSLLSSAGCCPTLQ